MRTKLAVCPLLVMLLSILCAGQSLNVQRRLAQTRLRTSQRTAASGGAISLASWTPLFELAASKNDNPAEFGVSVSVSGNVAVVGSSQDENSTGAAYVFARSSGGLAEIPQTARLTASDGHTGDEFGASVSISGNVIIVGAPSANSQQGKAYIFVKPPSGWTNMTETAQLTASDGLQGDAFGNSVAIDGVNAVVGAPYRTSGSNLDVGIAYVFVQPSGGWSNITQSAELSSSNGTEDAQLGFSVAISGKTVVAGAFGAAVACVFVEPAGGWINATQTAELGDNKQSVKSQLGYSVAISGSTIVTGAPNGTTGGGRTGTAQVYVKSGNAWKSTGVPTATLSASRAGVGFFFGHSVATTGTTVLVGAPDAWNAGYVYAFAEPASGWADSAETTQLYPADGQNQGSFGASVAGSGPTVLIGATGTQTAYVYQYASNSNFAALSVPGSDDTFALGVNNQGDIVGDYSEQGGCLVCGYLYTSGTFTTITYPGAIETFARQINSSGEIVGSYILGSTDYGYTYQNGILTSFSYPGSTLTDAEGINDAGDIVGAYQDGEEQDHGYLYSNGVFTTIDVPGAYSTDLNGINDSGQIVGTSCASPCLSLDSFVYQNGTFVPFNGPHDTPTNAAGINNNGDLTGVWLPPGHLGMQSFLYVNSTKQFISFPMGPESAPYNLNDSDEIVGYSNGAGYYGHLPGR